MQKSRKRTSSQLGWTIVTLAVLAVLIPQAASAWWWLPNYEMDLWILGAPLLPNNSDDPADYMMATSSGWPLTFLMKANWDFQGFGQPSMLQDYPLMDSPYPFPLVFHEPAFGPDLCPSWAEFPLSYDGCQLTEQHWPWPIDETIVPFTAGVTAPGFCCAAGDPFCAFGVPDCELGPVIASMWGGDSDSDGKLDVDLYDIGPGLGVPEDGYGYGANRRLPGLVITSDVGPTIITDENFNRTNECWNAAGFVQSVSYVLSNRWYHTTLTAHMVVPPFLFSPVVLADNVLDVECAPGGEPKDSLVRVDGLPYDDPSDNFGASPAYTTQCVDGNDFSLWSLARDTIVTVRAFVVQVDVNGDGPDKILDLDLDGDCDGDDAEAMGWELLSAERSIRFTQRHELHDLPYWWDFDNNGKTAEWVAPQGPGAVKQPPR